MQMQMQMQKPYKTHNLNMWFVVNMFVLKVLKELVVQFVFCPPSYRLSANLIYKAVAFAEAKAKANGRRIVLDTKTGALRFMG